MSSPDAPSTSSDPVAPVATQMTAPVPTTPYAPGRPSAVPSRAPGGADPLAARRSGPAIAAFVVGLVSLLLSAVPVVNAISVVGGLVAVVLAVLALRERGPGVSGKGLAITGIVLGAVATVVAVVVWVVLGAAATALEESGELDALLEEAAAVQEAAEADAAVDAAAEQATVPAEDATEVAAAEPAEVPADVVREDFSDISCDVLGEEAVLMSQEEVAGQPVLVSIRESQAAEDHRADYAVPAGAEESLVLSCVGTATWDDGSQSSVLTDLTIDGTGELFVAYAGE